MIFLDNGKISVFFDITVCMNIDLGDCKKDIELLKRVPSYGLFFNEFQMEFGWSRTMITCNQSFHYVSSWLGTIPDAIRTPNS